MTNLDYAKRAYEAYAEQADNKNYLGLPMPTFDELPENIKMCWEAATIKIRKELLDEINECLRIYYRKGN